MAGAFVVGSTLVSSDELDEKTAMGDVERFRSQAAKNKPARLRLFAGEVTTEDVETRPAFEAVGIGKPLTIEMRTVYTGDAPGRLLGFLLGDPSLLVTSGAKAGYSSKAAPRAINQLVEKAPDFEHFEPSAFRKGSTIFHHAPAAADRVTLTSCELVVDSFDAKLVESLSSIFSVAAGLPIFAPANAYLLAGSLVSKVFGKLGKALIESDPFLRSDLPIHIDSPGIAVTKPSHIVYYNKGDEQQFLGYRAEPVRLTNGQEQIRLVDPQSGNQYAGKAPYVIAALDGGSRPELRDFAPLHASAELLDDFYRADAGNTTLAVLGEALTYYNDMQFRKKAARLSDQISELPEGSAERSEAEALLGAYQANIQTDILKLG